jgi:spore germination protein
VSRERQPGSPRAGPRLSRRPRRFNPWVAWPAITVFAVTPVAVTLVHHLHEQTRPSLAVAAMPYWNLQRDTNVVLANRAAVNEASPWIYGLSASGAIVSQYSPDEAAGITADIARVRSAHLLVVPSLANVTDGNWDYAAIASILHDSTRMRQHVAAVVALVDRNNYAGIDIDYEELHSGDRQVFTQFITELSAALHAHGKVLSVAVFGQTAAPASDDPDFYQDYAALGKVADQIRIMGYNEHWANSAPGATAPIGWVRSVLRYATSQMPASKVVLGVPLFGFDWPAGQPGTNVTYPQAVALARQHHAAVKYDQASQAPYFSYTASGRTHTVWYEDAASSKAKFEAARSAGAAGVYLWMYGPEDPGTWSSLRAVLPVSSSAASSIAASGKP